MVKCDFCGKELPQGAGKIYAKKDGTAYHLCSNKCEKNLIVMKRKPVKIKWTVAYNKLKQTLLSSKEHHKEDEKATKKVVKESEKKTKKKK